VLLIDINDLIGFSDITGFLTYSLVAVGLLMIRYCNTEIVDESNVQIMNEEVATSSSRTIEKESCLNEEVNEMESDKLLPDSQSADNLVVTSQALPVGEKLHLFSQLTDSILKKNFFRNRMNAMFLIYFLFFSNISYFFMLNFFHGVIKKAIVFLIVLSNCTLTVVLSCFKQNSYKVSFKVSLEFLLRRFMKCLFHVGN
jgi:hypothetical protein